jgi:hypothetical protein
MTSASRSGLVRWVGERIAAEQTWSEAMASDQAMHPEWFYRGKKLPHGDGYYNLRERRGTEFAIPKTTAGIKNSGLSYFWRYQRNSVPTILFGAAS